MKAESGAAQRRIEAFGKVVDGANNAVRLELAKAERADAEARLTAVKQMVIDVSTDSYARIYY